MAVAGPKRPMEHRVHDYLYDSTFIVSGARDYARTVFKAAMGSVQPVIQPVFRTMFSEIRHFPRMRVVMNGNCRLPSHLDRSYNAYVARVEYANQAPEPQIEGKDQRKFCNNVPMKVKATTETTPDFHPPSPAPTPVAPGKPRNKGTQSRYRESSAQTVPWQPEAKISKHAATTPEVFYLDKLKWGNEEPYRTGDLPADFHTTEIINKMRHARIWTQFVEKASFPRWMKKRDAIIQDIETKDWIFREAEIDELQDIRLTLLHKLQKEQRADRCNKTSQRLARRWAAKKKEMEEKIELIRRSRDREIRKLTALHQGGGRLGQVQRMRASRGMGSMTKAVLDPTSDIYAPVARHGHQGRLRHAHIIYDPSLLLLEDHHIINAVPKWLEECGQDLKKTCSGHVVPRDVKLLCERETKWSEQFLANLHEDLRKARLGAAKGAGPLHVLKPRRLRDTPRPSTPEVESVTEVDEQCHQSALILQRIIRGRAVQCLMYEGRTRAAELTEELKTTHGLQKEDKIRIATEEAKARDYNALRNENEQKEDAITALVDELCGGAVSAALDFLEKELRRLKEERRQHAFILIALREKQMREAAEAGRRQKEEQRRREHDEMFKQVLGITQETVEAYLYGMIEYGVEKDAKQLATARVLIEADRIDEENRRSADMSTAETNELVADLVHQCLLPTAHKTASRMRIQAIQQAKLETARKTIFGLLEMAEIKPPATCVQCGTPLDEQCRCGHCKIAMHPRATDSQDDPRWKFARRRPLPKEQAQKVHPFPPHHEFRCMLNDLLDDVVVKSRAARQDKVELRFELDKRLKEDLTRELECKEILNYMIDVSTGDIQLPVKERDWRFVTRHIRGDALARTEDPPTKTTQPKLLPSEVRRIEDEKAANVDPYCKCVTPPEPAASTLADPSLRGKLLPTELRVLEDLRRCKCDSTHTDSQSFVSGFTDSTEAAEPEEGESMLPAHPTTPASTTPPASKE